MSLWVLYGLAASFLAAVPPLAQEKLKASPLALAVGIKVGMVLMTLPFVINEGLPVAPAFYVAIAATSAVWCLSDVYYYRAVQIVGAGPVSRLLPVTAIISFIAWFFVKPDVINQYVAEPWIGVGITACIVMATVFASRLTRCAVSRQAVGLLWFVMLASAMDPIAAKLILHSAGAASQAPFAYVFVEAIFMLLIWGVYAQVRRSAGGRLRVEGVVVRAAVIIGMLNATRLIIQNFAYMDVDNPALLRVLMFTDALWIIAFYKLVGRREAANVWAGLGIVVSAAGLVLLKSL